MKASAMGVRLSLRMNWNQGQEDFPFVYLLLKIFFFKKYFLPPLSSQPYDSQVHMVKKNAAELLMYYRLGDRPERKTVSLVANFKFLGKRFGSFWLNHCTESRVRGRAVRTHVSVCGQG